MKSSIDIYNIRKTRYEALMVRQKHLINFISMLRLIIFVSGAAFAIYFYIYKRYIFSISLILITLVAFIILVVKHSKVIENRNLAASVKKVNDDAISRVSGGWRSFADNGDDFRNEGHNYSEDLDLFGPSSLFQWICSATTQMGRNKLSNLLAAPKLDKDEITERQDAVLELSNHVGWRQRLAAEGKLIGEQHRDIRELLTWCTVKTSLPSRQFLKPILIILPLLTSCSIIYFYVKPEVGYSIPLIFIAISIIMLKLIPKSSREVLDTCYKYKKNLRAYYKMLLLIERKGFNSKLLTELKLKITRTDGFSASSAIKKLSKISDKISDRSNLFSIIINIVFLLDYHLILNLEQWKQVNGDHIEEWLCAIGDFESLSSLSNISFDNKEWTIPVINTDSLIIQTKAAAHPLLSKNVTSNSIEFGQKHTALLITGSNMSGKSTFLRTIGVNLVLAYAGAPVRASYFKCSLMNIYSCMRISDNLDKNISSFYAEILRVRKIVDAAKSGETIFYLLDEIFKGTNSADRHIGAETLINNLCKEKALGLVSTHDLELADMEEKNGKVKNYNFQEYYENNEIKFDYKLRTGISKTRNAIYLMKLAGIDFEEDMSTHILT